VDSFESVQLYLH